MTAHDPRIDQLREMWLTDSDLAFLQGVPPQVLDGLVREVRDHQQRTEAAQARLYEVMAKSTRFIPKFMIVKLSHSLHPYVMAQITEHMEVKAAASLAKSFDAGLLGEIAVHLHVPTTARIAREVQLDKLAQVVDAMLQRHLYRRLGELSDGLDTALLQRLVARVEATHVAEIASHMHDHTKLGQVSAAMDAGKRRAVVQVLQDRGDADTARRVGGG